MILSRFAVLSVSLTLKVSLFQLAAELAPGSAVGVDPALFKAATEAEYQAKWGTRLTIKHLPANLVDTIWMTRPIDPANNILIHPEELAGESVRDKLARVRAALADEKVAALILNALDQVRNVVVSVAPLPFAFLPSVRCFCPVAFSYRVRAPDRLAVQPAGLGYPLQPGVLCLRRRAAGGPDDAVRPAPGLERPQATPPGCRESE